MRSITPLIILLSSTLIPSTLSQSPSCIPCLFPDEAPAIASRWLNSFATNGISGLSDAVHPDIHIYDSGATNATLAAYITNSSQLFRHHLAGAPTAATAAPTCPTTSSSPGTAAIASPCDRQQNVVTTRRIGYGSNNVPPGAAIGFPGLQIC